MPTFTGTDLNDTLTGGAEDDTLIGAGGDDVLTGGGGNDVLYPGSPEPTAFGSSIDTLSGEAGDDRAVWTQNAFTIVFDGGAGTDTIDYGLWNPGAFFFNRPLTLQVGATGEIEASAFFYERGGGGTNQIVGRFTNIERIVASQYANVDLGSYARSIEVEGSAFADRIVTGTGYDRVRAGAGADTVNAGAGDDVVMGGAGDDVLDGGAGFDIADFSDATSAVSVNLASGTATGGTGADRLAGFERLTGSAFDDVFVGGAGDDYFMGALGADRLTGGDGRDTFRFFAGHSSADRPDTITDFTSGADRLLVGDGTTAISIVRQDAGSIVFFTYRNQPLNVVYVDGEVNGSDIFRSLVGLYFDDSDLNANSGLLFYAAFTIVGRESADRLVGGLLDDVLTGGGGSDVLVGDRGADVLSGGPGADVFLYTTFGDSTAQQRDPNGGVFGGLQYNEDNIVDFETGSDRIDLTAVGLTAISIIRDGGSSFIFGSVGSAPLRFQLHATGRDINARDIVGYSGGVYMVGSAASDVLIGGAAADSFTGGDGADVIVGGAGADQILGGAGADTFRYLSAADSGPNSQDALLDFQTGVDRIDLGALTFSAASIVRDGSLSFVFLTTTQGASMRIGANADINAGDLNLGRNLGVYLQGTAGADTLIGGEGSDALNGGAGADILIGGRGAETLYGGAGADIFRYTAATDSPLSPGQRDVITDFVTGVDRIDLSPLRTGAADVFGIAVWNGDRHLFVDLGGDGVNELQIIVVGAALALSDIIWTVPSAASQGPFDAPAPAVGLGEAKFGWETTSDPAGDWSLI